METKTLLSSSGAQKAPTAASTGVIYHPFGNNPFAVQSGVAMNLAKTTLESGTITVTAISSALERYRGNRGEKAVSGTA